MFELRAANDGDYEFLWNLRRTVMRPYIEATWGWDEEWQANYFRDHFAPAACQMIQVAGVDVGMLAVEALVESVFLANIEIIATEQGRGLGTAVIRSLIADAARRGLLVTLQVLKVNPARRLYERLGFEFTGETATHFLMTRRVGND